MENPASAVSPVRAFSLAPLMFQNFSCTLAIMAFVALVGPVARILSLEPWHIGAAMTMGGFTWILCARWWGGLSDRHGRRPIMLIGLTGFTVSYFGLCLFIDLSLRHQILPMLAFLGLVVGRVVVGLFYAAVPATAAATVADNVEPDKRAGAMALLGAASGAGMVIGPGFVGLLAPYGLGFPMYVTAVLPVLALVLVWWRIPRQPPQAAPVTRAPKLQDSRLRRPIVVAFSAAFSVSIAQVTVGFFALDQLGLPAPEAAQVAGIALTVVGVALIISQSILRKLSQPPARLIRIGALVSACGFMVSVWVESVWGLWACFGLAAAGMGWVYPSVSALAANSVSSEEQGAAAGTVTAAQGVGVVVGPMLGTFIYAFHATAPYVMVAVLLLAISVWVEQND